MEVIYSVGVSVPGGGIGNLSNQALGVLSQKKYLKKAIVGSNKSLPKDLLVQFPWVKYISGYYWKDLVFDTAASFFIERCDIFHGWNNMALQSLRKAKNKGAVTIIERASSHIL